MSKRIKDTTKKLQKKTLSGKIKTSKSLNNDIFERPSFSIKNDDSDKEELKEAQLLQSINT